LNVFAQTLPTSIAEVVICWAVLGTAFESFIQPKGRRGRRRIASIIIGAIVATILFGVYHFAHSPPFNQPNMVLFLIYPGILTSIVYFVGRDVYATIIFHKFQALFGVMMGIDLESSAQLLYPILILATISTLVLVISDLALIRRTR
jgi:membrane protease YdiL (CAAX protease family)